MRRAVCPGSFDPVTNGHHDIVRRAAALFDEVIVAVLVNEAKRGMFTVDERLEMLREALSDAGVSNVKVDSFEGLLVEFCSANDVDVIVKGIRAAGDVDFEVQMAQMNRSLSGIETVLVPTSPEWSYVASSLVKEVARHGGDVSSHVPPAVLGRLGRRLSG
jgi:pantetheine-phosphate adenylyltransferase